MPLRSGEIARRDGMAVLLRSDPLRLSWLVDELLSQDGHELRVKFACSVRPLPEPAERKMFEEVFLEDNNYVEASGVIEHLRGGLRSAAAGLCRSKPAAQWLEDGSNQALCDAMRAAGEAVAFTCGLELLSPFVVEVESPTLQQHQFEQMQREMAERRTAGQVESLQRAADLLKQFEQVRQSAPQLSAGQVLQQMAPADQGSLLQTLLQASVERHRTRTLWAVAGTTLLRIAPVDGTLKTQLLPIPDSLGPLRSVQHGADGKSLLLGARNGVWMVDASELAGAKAYFDTAVVSQLGFSRVVQWRDRIWACHSEAGIVAWEPSQVENPASSLRPADLPGTFPRNLQVLDDSRLIFSSADRLLVLEGGSEASPRLSAAPSQQRGVEIVAVFCTEDSVLVIFRDGTVQLRNRQDLEIQSQQRRSGEVTCAAMMPWLGSQRLLLATEDGPILGVGLDDDLVMQYLNSYGGLKSISAAGDLIVGISEDRQRVLVWQTWDPRRISGELFVPAVVRHRAADVEVS